MTEKKKYKTLVLSDIHLGARFSKVAHAIEFLNKRYEEIFPILTSYPELENYLSPFMDAWKSGAQEQLQRLVKMFFFHQVVGLHQHFFHLFHFQMVLL